MFHEFYNQDIAENAVRFEAEKLGGFDRDRVQSFVSAIVLIKICRRTECYFDQICRSMQLHCCDPPPVKSKSKIPKSCCPADTNFRGIKCDVATIFPRKCTQATYHFFRRRKYTFVWYIGRLIIPQVRCACIVRDFGLQCTVSYEEMIRYSVF